MKELLTLEKACDLRDAIISWCEGNPSYNFEGFEDRLHDDLISDLCYIAGDEAILRIFADYLDQLEPNGKITEVCEKIFAEWEKINE